MPKYPLQVARRQVAASPASCLLPSQNTEAIYEVEESDEESEIPSPTQTIYFIYLTSLDTFLPSWPWVFWPNFSNKVSPKETCLILFQSTFLYWCWVSPTCRWYSCLWRWENSGSQNTLFQGRSVSFSSLTWEFVVNGLGIITRNRIRISI